jgi:hypothetical protein
MTFLLEFINLFICVQLFKVLSFFFFFFFLCMYNCIAYFSFQEISLNVHTWRSVKVLKKLKFLFECKGQVHRVKVY